MFFFSSLNQCYDIIICVYCFELFSQVSDVAHGPLVSFAAVVFLLFSQLKYSLKRFVILKYGDFQFNFWFGFIAGKFKTKLVKEWVEKLYQDRSKSSGTWRKYTENTCRLHVLCLSLDSLSCEDEHTLPGISSTCIRPSF